MGNHGGSWDGAAPNVFVAQAYDLVEPWRNMTCGRYVGVWVSSFEPALSHVRNRQRGELR